MLETQSTQAVNAHLTTGVVFYMSITHDFQALEGDLG